MEIYFLASDRAHNVLRDLHINKGCTKPHHNNIIEFNADQKTELLLVMKKLERILEPHLLGIGRIDFILLKPGVYWDFPFTWGKSVIAMTPTMFGKPSSQILKILAHELVHLDQRRPPDKYEQYYTKLGFKKLRNIDFGALKPYLLRNPDADTYNWIWKNKYVPVALLRDCKFHVLLLEPKTLGLAAYGDNVEVILHKVESIPSYYERFGTKKQLYHPNEISAHLIADFLIDQIEHVPIDYDDIINLLN